MSVVKMMIARQTDRIAVPNGFQVASIEIEDHPTEEGYLTIEIVAKSLDPNTPDRTYEQTLVIKDTPQGADDFFRRAWYAMQEFVEGWGDPAIEELPERRLRCPACRRPMRPGEWLRNLEKGQCGKGDCTGRPVRERRQGAGRA